MLNHYLFQMFKLLGKCRFYYLVYIFNSIKYYKITIKSTPSKTLHRQHGVHMLYLSLLELSHTNLIHFYMLTCCPCQNNSYWTIPLILILEKEVMHSLESPSPPTSPSLNLLFLLVGSPSWHFLGCTFLMELELRSPCSLLFFGGHDQLG